MRARTRSRVLGHLGVVLAAYTGVALWVTRPLLWHFTDHSLAALLSFDIPFNAWILSWATHAAITQPLHFFDANIYHPVPQALAYTEHMLGSVPFFAPGFLATGNPAIALNLMILAGLVLSAATTYWVTLRWTGSWPAALFAGLLFGFYPSHVRAVGPNLQTLQYFPVILLFLDRVLAAPGPGATAGLTLALAGQSLASYYYAYPAVLATGAAALTVLLSRGLRPSAAALGCVVLALGLTVAVMALVSLPYFAVAARGRDTVYSWIPFFESLPIAGEDLIDTARQWVGTPPVLLALLGLVLVARPGTDPAMRRRLVILVTWVVVGHLLSAGRTLVVGGYHIPLPSRLLQAYAPGFAALRDRGRLFVVVPAALAVLGGVGLAGIAAACRPGRRRTVVSLASAAVAVTATALATDLRPCGLTGLPTAARVPTVYRALADRERAPVLELPVGATPKDFEAVTRQTWYEYFSIFHWRPLLNGYASYWPLEFDVVMGMARGLPRARALGNLVACTGVGWIVVHTASLRPAERAHWTDHILGLRLAGRFDEDLLYRVVLPANASACPRGILAPDGETTLEGTPRTLVPPAERRAVVKVTGIPGAITHNFFPRVTLAARVRVRNAGRAVWPALGVGDTNLVQLGYRWLDAAGRPIQTGESLRTRLPADMHPGDISDVPLAFSPPGTPGTYQFQVVVEQDPGPPFETTGPAAQPVTVTVY